MRKGEAFLYTVKSQLDVSVVMIVRLHPFTYVVLTITSLTMSSHNTGIIGDWKNMFTEEQSQYLESVLRSKMKDCPLEFIWEERDEEETPGEEEIPQEDTEQLDKV